MKGKWEGLVHARPKESMASERYFSFDTCRMESLLVRCTSSCKQLMIHFCFVERYLFADAKTVATIALFLLLSCNRDKKEGTIEAMLNAMSGQSAPAFRNSRKSVHPHCAIRGRKVASTSATAAVSHREVLPRHHPRPLGRSEQTLSQFLSTLEDRLRVLGRRELQICSTSKWRPVSRPAL